MGDGRGVKGREGKGRKRKGKGRKVNRWNGRGRGGRLGRGGMG